MSTTTSETHSRYSDPRRNGNDDGRGIENVLISVIPGLAMSGPRPGGFGEVPVIQYCLEGDPICDLPSPTRHPVSPADVELESL